MRAMVLMHCRTKSLKALIQMAMDSEKTPQDCIQMRAQQRPEHRPLTDTVVLMEMATGLPTLTTSSSLMVPSGTMRMEMDMGTTKWGRPQITVAVLQELQLLTAMDVQTLMLMELVMRTMYGQQTQLNGLTQMVTDMEMKPMEPTATPAQWKMEHPQRVEREGV
jgi:hypothetical protein